MPRGWRCADNGAQFDTNHATLTADRAEPKGNYGQLLVALALVLRWFYGGSGLIGRCHAQESGAALQFFLSVAIA